MYKMLMFQNVLYTSTKSVNSFLILTLFTKQTSAGRNIKQLYESNKN